MDNSPRTPADANPGHQHGHMVWVDATLQALLSARMLSRMAGVLGRSQLQSEMDLEAAALHRLVNETLWDETEGCYCDRFRDGRLSSVKHAGTVHENYAPERGTPGNPAKGDFVGWGGVPPVAVFLEYVLGLRADVPTNTLTWDVRRTEGHGVRRYPFATDGLLDLHCAGRANVNEKPVVSVSANLPVRLDLRWHGGRELLDVRAEGRGFVASGA